MTYYVYLESPYGKELIGSGSKAHCEEIKELKDSMWKMGDMWRTYITNKKENEYTNYWD